MDNMEETVVLEPFSEGEDEQETVVTLEITPEQAGVRLDKLLPQLLPELTRSALQKLIEQGCVTRQGKGLAKSEKVSAGDCITVVIPAPEEMDAKPEAIPLDIVYEDDDLLVVNKPKGMVVHPAPGHTSGTLVNALLYHCGDSLSGINGVIRPGIVHRIDKDTSGLLIVAKNDTAHRHLAAQIKEHSFTRVYEAVVYGKLKEDAGTVDAPIGRHPTDRKRMCVTEKNSRNAVTHYEVLERYPGFTHVRLKLETGRTHQIRVHMAYLGHPVAGDPVYGVKKVITSLGGQCLHARVIGFVHPRTGEYLEFGSDLPPYFQSFLRKLQERGQ
jgi:23S rRNA pseudouridine1911/1915/1917 synthase